MSEGFFCVCNGRVLIWRVFCMCMMMMTCCDVIAAQLGSIAFNFRAIFVIFASACDLRLGEASF